VLGRSRRDGRAVLADQAPGLVVDEVAHRSARGHLHPLVEPVTDHGEHRHADISVARQSGIGVVAGGDDAGAAHLACKIAAAVVAQRAAV